MPYKNKCFSDCKGLIQPECSHPMCKYNNGMQYQYCRLSHNLKMDPEDDCAIIVRTKNEPKRKNTTRKAHKAKQEEQEELPLTRDFPQEEQVPDSRGSKTPQPMEPVATEASTRKSLEIFMEKMRKANATRKIKKFMKKHEDKRRALFLKSICSDSNVCIAFGTESDKITKHFNNFKDFSLLSKPAKTIGSVSSNGFIKLLTYKREGYDAHAILKSSKKDTADNLIYEYFVGLFINKMEKRFPCFVKTYGFFEYTNPAVKTLMMITETNEKIVDGILKPVPENQLETYIDKSCKNPQNIAVLIQNLPDAKPIMDHIKIDDFNNHDLLYALYQVYMPLAYLGNNFTHYDLHYENVLLYEPIKNHYIQYNYHITDSAGGLPSIITFKSKYIAKIIDYGRCYFNDIESTDFMGSSTTIYDKVCKMPHCVDCGYYHGFKWLKKPNPKTMRSLDYICSYVFNKSHDLRLMHMLKTELRKKYNKTAAMPDIFRLINKTVYGTFYGTKENVTSGFPNKINNIHDAYKMLETHISEPFMMAKNERHYAGMQKLGDLHIYDNDRPMRYVPA